MPVGSRLSMGPTRWAVEVKHDPPRVLGEVPRPVKLYASMDAPDKVDASGADSSSPGPGAVCGGPDHPDQPAFWRVNVDVAVVSRQCAAALNGCAADAPLPRLLHVRGKAAGRNAIVFLDSGAQLNLTLLFPCKSMMADT